MHPTARRIGQEKMRRLIKTFGLSAAGFAIVLCGFVYDVLFAGIPYPDPAPALQARYDFHSFVAGLFYKTGGVAFLLGLLAISIIWAKTKKRKIAGPAG
jgi:hypothetical protein